MLIDLCNEIASWWAGVTPAFAFLLALPFGIALLGLLVDGRRAVAEGEPAEVLSPPPRPGSAHRS